MYIYIDILQYIQKYLYIKNNIILSSTSKFFYNNIDISCYIKTTYNISFSNFKEIYLDIYKYNIILNNCIIDNYDTIILICDKMDNKYCKNFSYIINYEIKFQKKYGYIFELLLYKIRIINYIIPTLLNYCENTAKFCLLYSKYVNNNKYTKYTFDVQLINKKYILYKSFCDVIKYNINLFQIFFDI